MSVKAAMVFAVTLASFFTLAGCNGELTSMTVEPTERSTNKPANARTDLDSTAEKEPNARARMSDAEAITGNDENTGGGAVARAGGAEARAGYAPTGGESAQAMVGSAVGESASQQVTLKVRGGPGMRFSGKCAVGDAEKAIGGRVPERYDYELGDEELECEIRKQTTRAGTLQIVLVAEDNVRSVQQIDRQRSTIKLTYSNGTSTSTSSVSTNQTITSSVSSSSAGSP